MKQCRDCEALIPDQATRCPHCRQAQRHGERLPQLLLVGFSLAAAVAVLLEGCPDLGLR